jgi:hypothetical protein
MFDQIVRVNEQIVMPKIKDRLVTVVDENGQPLSIHMRDDISTAPSVYRDMWDGSAWMKTISRNFSFWIDDYLSKLWNQIFCFKKNYDDQYIIYLLI